MKTGFVAVIGRPSAGKTTLMNKMCGYDVAITSPVPQTTRNVIRGIVNTQGGQIVFLDTPGYHKSEKLMNRYLKDQVHKTLNNADAILYVLDASCLPGPEELALIDLLTRVSLPIVAAVNKIDLNTSLLPMIRGLVLSRLSPTALINVSALKGSHLNTLVEAILQACPEGEAHYPPEFYTDQSPEFRIAEIIRGETLGHCTQELPHALYVEIADMEFDPGDSSLPDGKAPAKKLWVRAFVVVERPSQVGIIVGSGGQRIKTIRVEALKRMKKVFPWKIKLDLRVKANPKWRKDESLLKRMLD